MKKLTVFAAALLTAGLAMADSGLTRQQVLNDLVQARSTGELARNNSEDTALFLNNRAALASTTTRAQVLAELTQARASGELARLNSEDGSRDLRQASTSTVTRAQVLAELKKAQENGEYARLNSNLNSVDTIIAANAAQAGDSGSGQ